ncbi:MAG: phospholipase D-like domain-containing protein, partial [Nitrosopumilaceae archaeon]
ISREDIASLVRVLSVSGNSIIPFMNGGPAGENWNKSPCGFYDWIDNRTNQFIIGVELGFKADDYGKEVSKKLIEKKKANPNIYIGILIDGFVSVFLQKPASERDEFQNNTISMINDMKKAGIDVKVNDSWNPLSSDFLAANHVKMWLFDGKAAFFGGIGIESQFRTTLYDQMDLVKGPFVKVLTLVALLLMSNQRNILDQTDNIKQIHELTADQIKKEFLPEIPNEGSITFRLSMNVPGYVQDAQADYVSLLTRNDIQEVYIMAPYFSDDKIARGLIKAAGRLYEHLRKEKTSQIKDANKGLSDKEIDNLVREELAKDKRIHVVFPKKQENAIIEEVSRYYAYMLKDNPIVDTRQYVAIVGDKTFEMLHAKQMVVVLHDDKKNWTKYVKFGGSYNPAGRAHNMWELNAVTFNKIWEESDDMVSDNPVKNYLEEVMKVVVQKYSEVFPWGNADFKIKPWEKVVMKLAQLLWF